MSTDNLRLTRLERLPTEIIHAVVEFLEPWSIKKLSYTSKRLRQACLPTIFRRVKFEFSLAGIEGMKGLLKSNVRSYVTSFSYEVPELLKPEILYFDCFRSDILTPDKYVDMVKDMYDEGDDADDFPSYMSIYKTVHDICREQRSIIDEGADLILSSVFCALPLLKEVRLFFCDALQFDDCLLKDDIIIEEEYHQHHLQVVTSAIQSARRRGVAIHTISLCEFDLPYFHTWEEPDLTAISETLRRLLESIKVLRLRGSEWVLELLSQHALGLDQIDMCEAMVVDAALRTFLEANKKTIQSIGFHRVQISKARLHPSSHLTAKNTKHKLERVMDSTTDANEIMRRCQEAKWHKRQHNERPRSPTSLSSDAFDAMARAPGEASVVKMALTPPASKGMKVLDEDSAGPITE
ncbi:hypothetical protein G3M48_009321 [Beauveria asiatica]|uniref:F-box domain-containing protein n=1 Tax=Beauveria asiatica TaxID=1069075 RepID=A0AAW0RIW3_9HYPO